MKLGYDLASDTVGLAHANEPLASWYAPGHSDELGDRLLMFDNSVAPSLELLRFRSTLTATPGFEVALRRRVERLSHFRHPSFAKIRSVEYLGSGEGLALLSNYTPGKRLSEVLRDARGPAFATALIQQVTPALASLEEYGEGTGHGALTDSRIVVAPEGRLIIVEHVLGPALERLRLSASRWRTELGIAVPPDAATYRRVDSRTDYFQLGLIALSVLLGRRLSPDESHENIASLLEQVARTAARDSTGLFHPLRVWLERALQLSDQAFESSEDARDALDGLTAARAVPVALLSRSFGSVAAQPDPSLESCVSPEPGTAPVQEPSAELPAPGSPTDGVEPMSGPTALHVAEDAAEALLHPDPAVDTSNAPHRDPESGIRFRKLEPYQPIPRFAAESGEHSPPPLTRPVSRQEPPARGELVFAEADLREYHTNAGFRGLGLPISEFRPPMNSSRERSMDPPRAASPKAWKKSRPSAVQLLIALLGLCVIGEGIVIAAMLRLGDGGAPAAVVIETLAPGADVLVDGRSVGVTPLRLSIGADTRAIRVVDSRPQALTGADGSTAGKPHRGTAGAALPPPDARTGDSLRAAPPRAGGVRLVSPIEVEVFEGDRRLGSSTTGIVSIAAGRHDLELVNSLLGYRARQIVEVRNGQVVTVRVSPPNGRLSINALPWAEVWIGGKSVGETPLGNLSVPLGEHEIIFRHPQLGEHRQTAVVRLDGVTRVSANLQR